MRGEKAMRRIMLLVLAVILLLAGGGVAFVMSRARPKPPPPDSWLDQVRIMKQPLGGPRSGGSYRALLRHLGWGPGDYRTFRDQPSRNEWVEEIIVPPQFYNTGATDFHAWVTDDRVLVVVVDSDAIVYMALLSPILRDDHPGAYDAPRPTWGF
jgi:hypothetical protein